MNNTATITLHPYLVTKKKWPWSKEVIVKYYWGLVEYDSWRRYVGYFTYEDYTKEKCLKIARKLLKDRVNELKLLGETTTIDIDIEKDL